MDKITKLTELKKLLDNGLLTQDEFNNFKSELIMGNQFENNYVDDLNSTQTNHSLGRYLLLVLLFLGLLAVTSYIFYFKDEWKRESEDKEEVYELKRNESNFDSESKLEQKEEVVDMQGVTFDEINPRILYKPDPKALHSEWKERELSGWGGTFVAKKKIINSKGVFLFGDLYSTRGDLIGGGPFYVIHSEWDFSGIY